MKRLQLEIQLKGLTEDTWERVSSELPDAIVPQFQRHLQTISDIGCGGAEIKVRSRLGDPHCEESINYAEIYLLFSSSSKKFLKVQKRILDGKGEAYFAIQRVVLRAIGRLKLEPEPLCRLRPARFVSGEY